MCNLYTPASAADLARQFAVAVSDDYRRTDLFPKAAGWFVRRTMHDASFSHELVCGRWGLIPWFAKEPNIPYATNNARSEELAAKASFRQPWLRGQRCIIPVEVFWEPNWETGKNIWWSFRRADGGAFGLAGLWASWVDKATNELWESYTMLTINADGHELMGRMHKPDPKLPADAQDKRSVVVLEPELWDTWLEAPVDVARQLITLAPASIYDARPDPGRRAR